MCIYIEAAPKRNFIKENVKRMQELNRRSTPVGDSSQAFKRPSTSTSSPRRSLNSRMAPKNAITVIKEAPLNFPKSRSDESLGSSSSSNPSDIPDDTTATSSQTNTREVSIQTTDIKVDGFLDDAIIRHPSASVMDKLAQRMHSLKLKSDTTQRLRKIKQSYGINELGNYEDAESLLLDGIVDSTHDLRRSKQLAKLEEYEQTTAVKRDRIEFTEEEEKMLQRVRNLHEERMQRARRERMMKENVLFIVFFYLFHLNVNGFGFCRALEADRFQRAVPSIALRIAPRHHPSVAFHQVSNVVLGKCECL